MVADVVQKSGEGDDGFIVFVACGFWVESEFAGVDAVRERDYAVNVCWVVRGVMARHAGFHVFCHGGNEFFILWGT